MSRSTRFVVVSSLVLASVHAQSSAFAAEQYHPSQAPRTSSPAISRRNLAPRGMAQTRATAPVYSYSTDADFNFTSSAGGIGQFAYGPGIQAEFPMTLNGHRFAFGGQTGFYHSSKYEADTGQVKVEGKAWSIPVLVTGKYLFENGVPFLKPYLALAAGVSIDHVTAKGTPVAANTMAQAFGLPATALPEVKVSETKGHFAMLIRPGVTLGESQRWFVELPFGSMRKQFSILPTLGYHF